MNNERQDVGVAKSSGVAQPIISYARQFTFLYIVLILCNFGLITFLDVDMPNSMSMVILTVASLMTVFSFIHDHRRAPLKEEQQKLVWLSLGGCIGASLLCATVLLYFSDGTLRSTLSELITSLSTSVLILGISVTLLFYYLILRLCYGWIARFLAKIIMRD